jgi:hypothetical protein
MKLCAALQPEGLSADKAVEGLGLVVKRWRDGKMIKRRCAAGMLNAKGSFRRRKGCRQMPRFVAALARHVDAVPAAWDAARVA